MVNRILDKDTLTTIVTPSAFVLIKASQEADFIELYKDMDSCGYKIACDAVKGDLDIILSYKSDSPERTEAIYKEMLIDLPSVTKSEFLPIHIPSFDKEIKDLLISSGINTSSEINTEREDGKKVQSYILISADTQKISTIYPQLAMNENILYCGLTSGVCNIILLASGNQFNDIDKLVTKLIMNIDGVLKVKVYPVINIYDL